MLIATKPKVTRRTPEKMALLVRTVFMQPEDYAVKISAMGTVKPAREIGLEVQVSGEVIYVHPELTEGGMIARGEKILQVDPRDYELAVQQKRRALSEAEYAYKIEQGHQEVARKEWNLLYGDKPMDETESDLALRKPHLEKVQAEIKAARAELEQAEINLKRTILTAPFNALVVNSYVEEGSKISSQEKLADLVGADTYWVQVSVPIDRLKWIKIPKGNQKEGSEAEVYYQGNNVKKGRVARLLPDLSKEGRMARLLIEIEDPLGLTPGIKGQPILLLGEYVRVSIWGEELRGVYQIPRTALRNGGEVWVADAESKLKIMSVQTIWRDKESVIVQDGFTPGERLIISEIATPVAGMDLRLDQPEGSKKPGREKQDADR
ncbi:MAG: efflux RND transporter periplasmic adaptor subunit [Desulfobulbales bacterium]|nr:efflux RND transporter periplasmic adaptor subunit [Desulfobulbales bacterium]